MESAVWLGATAAKLNTVPAIGWAIAAIGLIIGVAGWGWLVFQNARFGMVHGVLSVILPPYALIFAFVGMEHRHKATFTTAFLGGLVVAGLGYMLVYAANDCENNPECGIRRDLTEDAQPGQDEGSDEGGESSALLRLGECSPG